MGETVEPQPGRVRDRRQRLLAFVGVTCVFVVWCVGIRYIAVEVGDARHTYNLQAIVAPPPVTGEPFEEEPTHLVDTHTQETHEEAQEATATTTQPLAQGGNATRGIQQ